MILKQDICTVADDICPESDPMFDRSWVDSWENQKQNGGNYILNFGLKLLEVPVFQQLFHLQLV